MPFSSAISRKRRCASLCILTQPAPFFPPQVIHLIRHGQGYHNVAGHNDYHQYRSEAYFDSHLNELGWQQAETLGRYMRQAGTKVDVVICSPLMRTLETAVGVFGQPPPSCSGAADATMSEADASLAVPSSSSGGGGGSLPNLMQDQTAVASKRVARQAVASHGVPTFVGVELCREHLGVHPCDRRREISAYRELFPAVDFSLVKTEADTWWRADHRETEAELLARAAKFVQYILTRPERDIAVVTHSSFLHHMMKNFTGTGSNVQLRPLLHGWYENCELRSFALSATKGVGVPPGIGSHRHIPRVIQLPILPGQTKIKKYFAKADEKQPEEEPITKRLRSAKNGLYKTATG